MKKFIGSKKRKTEENKIVKLFISGLGFQWFLSFFFIIENLNIKVFIFYNVYILITYFIIKKISTNILKYNVYNLYFILNIVPIFLYLLLIMMAIDNIVINLIILVPILILLFITQTKVLKKHSDKKRDKTSQVIYGTTIGVAINELIGENEILEGILFVSSLYFFYGVIFYMLRLTKEYEKSKLNDGN